MPQLIPLQSIPDPARGELVVGQAGENIPFSFPRIFMLCGMPLGGRRGNHAHRRQHQMLIAAAGEFRIVTRDGKGEETFMLESPALALHVPPLTWVTIEAMSHGATCLVLASAEFDEADYIRDPGEFERLIGR
jgi:hypothetical protein